MNNEPIADAKTQAKNEKTAKTVRVMWLILTPVFALIVLFRLYEWSRGEDNFRGILSPLGMIFLGLAGIFAAQNKTLRTILIAIALILVITGLVLMIVY